MGFKGLAFLGKGLYEYHSVPFHLAQILPMHYGSWHQDDGMLHQVHFSLLGQSFERQARCCCDSLD